MLTPLAPVDGDTILPLVDAKAHLRVLDTSEDTLIGDLRDAAIDWAEGYSGRALLTRSFQWTVDQFASTIRLPIGPVSAVTAISYYDSDGTDTALEAEDWYLGGDAVVAAHGTTWPYASGLSGGVRITFTAGYATAADIPPMLLAGVKLALTAMFEDRANPNLDGAMRCIDRHRTPVL